VDKTAQHASAADRQCSLPAQTRQPGTGLRYVVGVDVGSTTVKAVVVEAGTDRILWRDYQRHDTRQPEKLLEFLQRMEAEVDVAPSNTRMFITGSGGNALSNLIGAKFVQEVNAVSLAVEKLHPEVNSVIELGGQDAKIIIFKEDGTNGRGNRNGKRNGNRKKIPSMNDKCAGGTGAVIDKINAKLKIPPDELCNQGYKGIKIHPVAGKCGVFAETDINGLQKQGIPADELMASLFDAIVLQNLTVLTRGHTLRPHVLLLGGPNTFIRGMREAWQHNIPLLWKERGIELPPDVAPGLAIENAIKTPENALYFAAIGAVEFGKAEDAAIGRYLGTECLEAYIDEGRQQEKAASGNHGLGASKKELEEFKARYWRPKFVPAAFRPGERVRAFIGLDGGSTSTKAVLLSEHGDVLSKAYQLSNGNPIQDTIDLFENLRQQVETQGAALEVLGVGTTGYAKDVLQRVLRADVALVETVAHTESALRFYKDPHVIVDVGGQDIKLIVLRNGRVKDFKLNTQCSAGNGYFLQSTAEGFGIPVENYADVAFSASAMPVFGYGCAVFLQSDIVNFQRQGWRAEEILAGLATVLPRNVFLYVAKVASLAALGTRFILQGGTQNNLAAVKAEVDFLRANFRAMGKEPEIVVHQHCGESGAIGAGIEAMRLWRNGHSTTFIGLDAVRKIRYRTTHSEETRCHFCKNACLRTFLDVQIGDAPADVQTEEEQTGRAEIGAPPSFLSKVPLQPGEQRMIISTCEKGAVEDVETMRGIKAHLDATKAANPNLVEIAAREIWRSRHPESVADPIPTRAWAAARRRVALMKQRGQLRIGIPRVLNMYAYAPLFSSYLESLGVRAENIVYSDFTTGDMYRAGSSRGSIDPCFPSKITIAHVHNLIFNKHAHKPLQVIFFPMFDVLLSPLVDAKGHNACPTLAVTPETVEAAYTKETDLFAEHGIRYVHPLVNLSDHKLFARQMFQSWARILGLSEEENERAVEIGYRELGRYESSIRRRAREVLDQLESEQKLGIVMLGRPYHHDPGINHEIMEQFQKLGYSIFSQSTLPLDEDLLERLFGDEVRAGVIRHPLDISDVWKTANSASSNHKIWAAKFTARHPNLVAVEISSFKCGHDAPIYSVIEQIVERSGTPYFSFKDLDENRPVNTIKLRVETIDYFLKRYREDLLDRKKKQVEIDLQLAEYERGLREYAAGAD
jgi:activator of 2-hydroxyglutaryl-CoA dehydratase/predicted nucleotide-binding protein (sugar kinase/HSP70/actin superfamily)